MTKRTPMATMLQTKEQRSEMRGRAFKYGRQLMLDTKTAGLPIGQAPFSHIDAETIAQRAWSDGYVTALRDARRVK